MKNYKFYLFDADGTLFDTADMIYCCFESAFKKLGMKVVPKEEILSHIGLPLRKQLEIYTGPVSESFFENYRSIHLEHQLSIFKDYLVAFGGVSETLLQLRNRDKKCAVVTSRMKNTLVIFLKELAIEHYFDVLITPESTTLHKPHPEPALKAMELLGVKDVSEGLFIGDALFDIECGHGAGMDTAFVGWSRNNPENLSIKPTYILNDMKELI